MNNSATSGTTDYGSKAWYDRSKAVYDKFKIMADEGGAGTHGF